MIKNIKIQNIFDVIGISKSMELNKLYSLKINYEKNYLNDSYDFQSSIGPGKSRSDVLSGPPKDTFALYRAIHLCKIQLEHNQWLVSVSFVKRKFSNWIWMAKI